MSSLAHQSTLQDDLVFSQKIEEKKKTLPLFPPHNILHCKDPKFNHKIIEDNAKTYKRKTSKH